MQRCDELLGGRCIYLQHKLSEVCRMLGRQAQAKAYSTRAVRMNPAVARRSRHEFEEALESAESFSKK